VQTRESSMSAADRRQTPRTKLVEIAYIGMGPENGGLVLDVSEGGLSFHSVAPVQLDEKVQFLLSLRGHSRIEGTGEVVWTNTTGTVCGLKFTNLSPNALDYLCSWTNQSSSSARAQANRAAPAPRIVSAAPAAKSSPLSIVPADPVFAIPPAKEPYAPEPVTETSGQSPLFWMAVGALMMAVAGLAYSYGVREGQAKFSAPNAAVATTATQTNAPSDSSLPAPPARVVEEPQPGQTNLPHTTKDALPVPAHPFADSQKTDSLSGSATTRPVANLAPFAKSTVGAAKPDQVSDSIPHPSPDGGKSEYIEALSDLNGDNGIRDTFSAIRLLQVAVKKGNTQAEVTLADLYIYGDGVAQDCEHGRSLLIEASRSGDPQARVKLDELNTGGCPSSADH
jgi:PilZ domain